MASHGKGQGSRGLIRTALAQDHSLMLDASDTAIPAQHSLLEVCVCVLFTIKAAAAPHADNQHSWVGHLIKEGKQMSCSIYASCADCVAHFQGDVLSWQSVHAYLQ